MSKYIEKLFPLKTLLKNKKVYVNKEHTFNLEKELNFVENINKAVEVFKRAAEQGNEKAQFFLGLCYCKGDGVQQNINKAVELFKKASDKGEATAQYFLGIAYYHGEGIEKDISKAVELFKKASDQGEATAQYFLGVCYYNGDGVERNVEKAIELFEKASQQGEVNTQVILGELYYRGNQVEQNINKAVDLFKRASEQGNAKAQFFLGLCYSRGDGVKKDINKAVNLFKKASDQGEATAQYFLGIAYYHGEGVETDISKAVELFKKASDQGEATAQYFLGVCYYNGDGVERNVEKAIELFELSSKARMEVSSNEQYDKVNIKEKYTISLTQLASEKDILYEIKNTINILNNKCDKIINLITDDLLEHVKIEKLNVTNGKKLRIYDFIKNNALYINKKIEQSNKSTKEEEKYLKAIFRDKWNKLSDGSKKSLISEEVIWNEISKMIDCDFSAVCICLTSALELELNKYFFVGYKQYLYDTYGNPSIDFWPESMLSMKKREFNNQMKEYEKGICQRPYLKAKNRFTLGSLPYILCSKFGNISEKEKEKEKNILNKYIESILKDEYKKDAKTIFIEPYLNNQISFVEKCENVRKQYRNKAAHKGIINKNQAQSCYNEILGNVEDNNLFSGILLQLFEVLK